MSKNGLAATLTEKKPLAKNTNSHLVDGLVDGKREKTTRFVMDIDPVTHKKLKQHCVEREITIKSYILDIINNSLDGKYDKK